MKGMITLIGEQPVPNLLVLRHEQPAEVVFVCTRHTEEVANRLYSLLKNDIRVHFLQTDPYDIQMIRESLRECLQARDWPSTELVFNLTGGTKPMGFAAYQLAEELQAPFVYLHSEGKRSRLYRYEHQKGGYHKASDQLLPELITLDDYLRAHVDGYWVGEPKSDFGSCFEEAIAEALKEVGLEVLVGVHLAGALEVDLVVRRENQVGVIQAKTGKAASKKEGLDQLNAACEQKYLGTYTAKMLAINRQWDHTLSNLRELARAWRITVLESPSFTKVHRQLSSEDRRRLQSEVLRTLGG